MKMRLKSVATAVVLVPLLVAIVLGGCSGKPKAQKVSPKPQKKTQTKPAPTPQLSEQPDQAIFSQYFKKLSIGKLPAQYVDSKDWPWRIENTNVFSRGDTMATQGEVVKEVQPSSKYYDVQAKIFVGENVGGPMGPVLKPGGFAGTNKVDLPPGKYELKIYVGDKLVSVLPFEVR